MEGGRQVDRDHRVPLVLGELVDRIRVLDARIVDQDVQAPEAARRGLDRVVNLLGLRHVGAVKGDLDPGLALEGRTGLLDLVRVAEPVQHHLAAFLGERPGHGEPDPAGRSGDEGGLALQSLARRHIASLLMSKDGRTLSG
jgi:hypothetical protein